MWIFLNIFPTLLVIAIGWFAIRWYISTFNKCQVDNCPGFIIKDNGPTEILFLKDQRVLRETQTGVCDICGYVYTSHIEVPIPIKLS